MALFKFTRGILAGEAIPVFNRGEMVRDFTYVDDIVEGVIRVIDRPAQPDPAWSALAPRPSSSNAPYRIYNIGNNQPVKLMRYIEVLEQCLGRKAKLDLLPLQAGDVPETIADVSRLEAAVGFRPCHAGRNRHSALCRMVSIVLPGLIDTLRSCIPGGGLANEHLVEKSIHYESLTIEETMKILITGGGGFLGYRLALALLKRGTLANADGKQEPIRRSC